MAEANSSDFPQPSFRQAWLPLSYTAEPEQETSLIDLWIILVRRRWVVWGVLLLCLFLGLVRVLTLPMTYRYETAIQVGRVYNGGSFVPIDPVDSMLAKTQETYIPLARDRYLADHSNALGHFKLQASSPRGSDLIVISGEGSQAQQNTYLHLLNEVVDQARADQLPRYQAAMEATELERRSAESGFAQLKAEAKIAQTQLKRLDGWSQTLDKRLQDLRSDLQALRRQRTELLSRVKGDNPAHDIQMISLNGEIARLRDMVEDLQQQLSVGIPAQQDKISRQLEQNGTDQKTQQVHIQEIEARHAAMQPPQAVVRPQRLPEPVGLSRFVILAVAGVLGLMLGVFAAFIAEFLARANAVMKSHAEH